MLYAYSMYYCYISGHTIVAAVHVRVRGRPGAVHLPGTQISGLNRTERYIYIYSMCVYILMLGLIPLLPFIYSLVYIHIHVIYNVHSFIQDSIGPKDRTGPLQTQALIQSGGSKTKNSIDLSAPPTTSPQTPPQHPRRDLC